MSKQSFVVYDDWAIFVDSLPYEAAGELFKALFEYRRTGELPLVNARVQAVLAFMAAQIDKDTEKYEERCAKNRERVMKRWATVNNGIQTNTTVYHGIPTNTNDTDNDKDNDKDKDKDKDIKRKNIKKEKFAVPTLDEVRAYVKEKGYTFSPDAFHAFYTSKGWKVGSSPMKDWHAACVTWQTKEKKEKPVTSLWVRGVEDRSYDFDDLERRLMG